MANNITNEEIFKLMDERNMTIFQVIEVIIESNHLIGVGIIDLQDMVNEYFNNHYKSKPHPIPRMVLHEQDVQEFLPDATEKEIVEVAKLMGDGFMESWRDCLSESVRIVAGERRG